MEQETEKKEPKFRLELKPVNDDLLIGTMRNGQKYSVRRNRDRFFFPDEWSKFFDSLSEKQKFTFGILIGTGARINEARHIKVGDVDLERGNIILRVTKVKGIHGDKNPRPRTISISTQLTKKIKQVIREQNLKNDDYLPLLSRPASDICLKQHLKRIGIKDYYMFSLHNIRKSHGNYLKAMGIDGAEICTRLGHDMNTFLKHYSSSNIFNNKDMHTIKQILGDLYEKR